MLGKPRILSLFLNSFNKSNKTVAVEHLCEIFYFSLFEKYGLESPITYANWMAYGIIIHNRIFD